MAAAKTSRKRAKKVPPKAAETARKKAAKKTTKKATKKATTKRSAPKKAAARSSGGPRADKAEGKAAHAAALRKLPAEHRAMGERLDAIVTREVPNAARAVKWGSAMWGVPGKGWFVAFGSFKNYAKVNFFEGASLEPAPPEGEGKGMRSVNLASLKELDEAQLATWIRQAAALPGWGKA